MITDRQISRQLRNYATKLHINDMYGELFPLIVQRNKLNDQIRKMRYEIRKLQKKLAKGE